MQKFLTCNKHVVAELVKVGQTIDSDGGQRVFFLSQVKKPVYSIDCLFPATTTATATATAIATATEQFYQIERSNNRCKNYRFESMDKFFYQEPYNSRTQHNMPTLQVLIQGAYSINKPYTFVSAPLASQGSGGLQLSHTILYVNYIIRCRKYSYSLLVVVL